MQYTQGPRTRSRVGSCLPNISELTVNPALKVLFEIVFIKCLHLFAYPIQKWFRGPLVHTYSLIEKYIYSRHSAARATCINCFF